MIFSVLVFSVPAEFKSTPPDVVTAVEGTDVRFDCVVMGKPLPSIGWKKDLETVMSDGHIRDLGNGSLIIIKVNKSDESQYICLFQKTTNFGVDVAQFELRVVEPSSTSPSESEPPGTIR